MTHTHSTHRIIALLGALGLAFALLAAGPARAAEDGRVILFNGKDLDGWKLKDLKFPDTWSAVGSVRLDPANPANLISEGQAGGDGVLLRGRIAGKGSDIFTEKVFGDCELHVEVMIPRSANSGIYMMGQYEVQINDSFGKPADRMGQGDMGAIYSVSGPTGNPSRGPGEWQKFEIVFRAPRFDDSGKKIENARFISVKLNGQVIHENREVPRSTGGQLAGGEKPQGPLMLQGDHGIVAVRNVWYRPLELK
jgi:hypothetical protein